MAAPFPVFSISMPGFGPGVPLEKAVLPPTKFWKYRCGLLPSLPPASIHKGVLPYHSYMATNGKGCFSQDAWTPKWIIIHDLMNPGSLVYGAVLVLRQYSTITESLKNEPPGRKQNHTISLRTWQMKHLLGAKAGIRVTWGSRYNIFQRSFCFSPPSSPCRYPCNGPNQSPSPYRHGKVFVATIVLIALTPYSPLQNLLNFLWKPDEYLIVGRNITLRTQLQDDDVSS